MKNVKNLNLRKKVASVVTAFVLMLTPVIAHAEKGSGDAKSSFQLVQQEKKMVGKNLTVASFTDLVERCYNYTKKFFNYPNMQQDIQNVCYLLNRAYMSEEEQTEELLIKTGAVTPVDMEHGIFDSIISAQSFNNVRADYNQSMIRETNDPSKLFNMATFCFDESDREAYNDMFTLWVNSHLGDKMDVKSAYELFKILTTLNGMEGYRNVDDMNAGAKFEGQFTFGLDLMQVLQDFMKRLYSDEELSKYYVMSDLVAKQFTRNDRPVEECANVTIPAEDLEGLKNANGEVDSVKVLEYLATKVYESKKAGISSAEIEGYKTLLLGYLVDIHTQVRYHCLETSLNDLIKSFDQFCNKTK